MFAIVPRNRSQGRQPTQAQERALRSENPHAASPHEPGKPPCRGRASLSPCATSSRPALAGSPPAGSMAWLPAPSGFWELRPMHLRRRRLLSFASRILPGGVSAGPLPSRDCFLLFRRRVAVPRRCPAEPSSQRAPPRLSSLHVPTPGPRFPSLSAPRIFFLAPFRNVRSVPASRSGEREKDPLGGNLLLITC